MADTHGQPPKGSHDAHASHAADEEDLVKTPAWLPFLGIGLLAVGALATYLWILPGGASAQSLGDGAAGDAASESSVLPPTPPSPTPLPGAQAVRAAPSPMPPQVAPQHP
jgi:hypothetical protein